MVLRCLSGCGLALLLAGTLGTALDSAPQQPGVEAVPDEVASQVSGGQYSCVFRKYYSNLGCILDPCTRAPLVLDQTPYNSFVKYTITDCYYGGSPCCVVHVVTPCFF
jgi:hypothetical protein